MTASTDDSLSDIIPTQSSLPMFETWEDITSQPLTLSQVDFLANHIPLQAAEKARMIAGISGLSSPELSASYDPESCCWKTFPAYSAQQDWITGTSALLTPSRSLETCSKWVTWDAQALYQHPKPELPKKESDGFAWPTPTADDTTNRQPSPTAVITKTGTYRHVAADGEQSFMRLSQVVKMWPTPGANEASGGGSAKIAERALNGINRPSGSAIQLKLRDVVKLWTTPTAAVQYADANHHIRAKDPSTKAKGMGTPLPTQVMMWSTPAAQDAKNATLPAFQVTRDTLPGDIMRTGAAGQLNPDWVDLLMGLPSGYSNPDGLPVPANHNMITSRHVPHKKSKRIGRRGSGR